MKQEISIGIENVDDTVEKLKLFQEYFSDGEIRRVHIEDIPDVAKKRFEERSRKLTSASEYKPNDFEEVYLIEHANGDQTWITQQVIKHDEDFLERIQHIMDIRNKEAIGHGEIRYLENPPSGALVERPFVGYTRTYKPPETESDYQRQGLGMRRLLYMNALSQMQYHSPLHSGAKPEEAAISLWKHLMAEGKAQKILLGKKGLEHERYVFSNKPSS